MAKSKPVRTPLGTFASAAQAAAAHHCDRSTILNRVVTDPDNYCLVDLHSGSRTQPNPQGWAYYRSLSEDDRDAWYRAWCQDAGLDPDQDGSGDAFFDALDAVQDQEHENT